MKKKKHERYPQQAQVYLWSSASLVFHTKWCFISTNYSTSELHSWMQFWNLGPPRPANTHTKPSLIMKTVGDTVSINKHPRLNWIITNVSGALSLFYRHMSHNWYFLTNKIILYNISSNTVETETRTITVSQ